LRTFCRSQSAGAGWRAITSTPSTVRPVGGILAALYSRKRTGQGQFVETSILQGLLPFEHTGKAQQQPEVKPGKGFAAAGRPFTVAIIRAQLPFIDGERCLEGSLFSAGERPLCQPLEVVGVDPDPLGGKYERIVDHAEV